MKRLLIHLAVFGFAMAAMLFLDWLIDPDTHTVALTAQALVTYHIWVTGSKGD